MSKIKEYLDKKNLHHAYLVEGSKEVVLPEVFSFLEDINIAILNNPDLVNISIDNFKIDEAFMIKAMSAERGITGGKKIFIISANQFSLDAEHALLKLFEEPIEDTHFFIITPDTDALLKTFVSRFFLIKTENEKNDFENDVKEFISMPIRGRIDFLKNFMADTDDEGIQDSTRSKSLKFLNTLERELHSKVFSKNTTSISNSDFFYQILKAREFLRQPGSSTKSLMESVALCVPTF